MSWNPAATSQELYPSFDIPPVMSDAIYSNWDILVTGRVGDQMIKEGGLKASLFDQALLGPSLLCTLRGWKIDHAGVASVKLEIQDRAKALQSAFSALAGTDCKFGTGMKPTIATMATVFYTKFKVKARFGDTDSPTVGKGALIEILEDPKTPDEAVPLVEIALELTALEDAYKALNGHASPDGRMRSSFMVAADHTGRWSSRKDNFGDGMNLNSAPALARRVFVPDTGKILISMRQVDAESRVLAYLSGSQKYIQAHLSGNVHLEAAKAIFPELASNMAFEGIQETQYPGTPGKTYYDVVDAVMQACNHGVSPTSLGRQLHIKKAEASGMQLKYFRVFPEIQVYHEWVKKELDTKRRLVTPLGRSRIFLSRAWESSPLKEAVPYQAQSTVSDLTKVLMWRIFKHLDPNDAQLLMESTDSIIVQVDADKEESVMERLAVLSDMPYRIGSNVVNAIWEYKVGTTWADV